MDTLNKESQTIRCPLCGYRFDRQSAKACSGCPLGKSRCKNLVCCPHCGYSFVETSATLNWIRRLLRRRKTDETQT